MSRVREYLEERWPRVNGLGAAVGMETLDQFLARTKVPGDSERIGARARFVVEPDGSVNLRTYPWYRLTFIPKGPLVPPETILGQGVNSDITWYMAWRDPRQVTNELQHDFPWLLEQAGYPESRSNERVSLAVILSYLQRAVAAELWVGWKRGGRIGQPSVIREEDVEEEEES